VNFGIRFNWLGLGSGGGAVVNMLMNFRVLWKAVISLTSWATVSFVNIILTLSYFRQHHH